MFVAQNGCVLQEATQRRRKQLFLELKVNRFFRCFIPFPPENHPFSFSCCRFALLAWDYGGRPEKLQHHIVNLCTTNGRFLT